MDDDEIFDDIAEHEDVPIITIALYDDFPRVDLGSINPLIAISLFEVITDTLRDIVGVPSIMYDNEEIAIYYDADDTED